jgi:hypothetical protein
MSKPIEIVMNDELEKLLAAATPGLWKLFDGTTAPPWEVCTNKAGNCTIRQVGSSGYLSPWIASARDAALICAAVNALPELLAMAEENARLREALQAIADRHIPDQPPAYDVSEADYARKHYMELRMLARAALKETGQ